MCRARWSGARQEVPRYRIRQWRPSAFAGAVLQLAFQLDLIVHWKTWISLQNDPQAADKHGGVEASKNIIRHDAQTATDRAVSVADGPRLNDVEKAKGDKGRRPGCWVKGEDQERNPLAGYLIHHDLAGICNTAFSSVHFARPPTEQGNSEKCCRQEPRTAKPDEESCRWKRGERAPGSAGAGEAANAKVGRNQQGN